MSKVVFILIMSQIVRLAAVGSAQNPEFFCLEFLPAAIDM